MCCDDPKQPTNKPTIGNRHLDYNNYGNPNNYDDPNTGYDYPSQQDPNGYGNNRPNNGWGSDYGYPNQGSRYGYDTAPTQNYFNANNNPYVTSSPFFPARGHGRGVGNIGTPGQCPVTSFPPKPETGCCGREASDTDRIIGKLANTIHERLNKAAIFYL